MVLGLPAPASAAVTITALSPTSGPAAGDCVVVATGTGFKDFPAAQMTVEFVNRRGRYGGGGFLPH